MNPNDPIEAHKEVKRLEEELHKGNITFETFKAKLGQILNE